MSDLEIGDMIEIETDDGWQRAEVSVPAFGEPDSPWDMVTLRFPRTGEVRYFVSVASLSWRPTKCIDTV